MQDVDVEMYIFYVVCIFFHEKLIGQILFSPENLIDFYLIHRLIPSAPGVICPYSAQRSENA